MPRTKKEIDQDYSQNAVLLGHKKRVMENLKKEIDKLDDECLDHLNKLILLNEEGSKLIDIKKQEPLEAS
jgi:hypothetical protein